MTEESLYEQAMKRRKSAMQEAGE
ncbi:hypothetical protein B14911_07433 [Bacillus sp. NRRL B-14911]|nr:hypothetical protein B14911_07433 [Bacillus sp. NRRL B-14911]